MAAVLFPSIAPVEIRFDFGSFSVSRATAPAGSTTIRKRSSASFSFITTVDFGPIEDDLAADVFIAWNSARSTYFPLILPSVLYLGIQTALRDTLPESVQWYFATPPRFTSSPEIPGYTNTGVVFEAEY